MKRQRASWLLIVAVSLHNLEEGVGYSAMRSEARLLIKRVWPTIQLPTIASFQLALVLVTLAACGALFWAARTQRDVAGWFVVRAIAFILLANVVAPHVPAAIALGGYAPGVITAVTLNLPLSLWILWKARPSLNSVRQ